jgi:1,4-dihydroxy-2-naphthoate octaprenyltransferase
MTSRAQIWIEAARPKTLGAAIAPVLIGAALANAEHKFHAASVIAALLSAIGIQIGTNFCNDYCDFKKGADKERIGPVRATQAGLVTPQAMKLATVLAFGFAVLCSVYLIARGGWPVVAIGVASILAGVIYTAGPKPLAYVGLGDLFVLIFFGPVAVAGTYFVQTLEFSRSAAIAGIGPGLIAVAILVVNNLRDMEGDAKVGKRTLAVRLGATFSRAQYVVCVLAGCTLAVLPLRGTRAEHAALLGCAALASAFPAIRRVLLREGSDLNPALGMTGKVLVVYSVLFVFGSFV